MSSACRDYFSNLIAKNSSNQRKLFRTTNPLLFEPTDVSFPDHIPSDDLAYNFGNYFVQTIERINDSLDALQLSEPFDGDGDTSADNMDACANCVDPDPCVCAEFPNFKTLTQDQVSLIVGKVAMKSCPLDPAPISVVLEVLDVPLPVITCMINMSFESGLVAEEWRQALVLPTLKECGLEIAYKNFRPVSNLPYIFKLSERAAADQLIDHMTICINGLHIKLQSAYKRHHSTESALLKVKNDILLNMDAQKVTLLVLLDLSAAFATVRDDILLDRLRSRLGGTDQTLNWFTSYILDQTQRVAVSGGLSDTFPLAQGVPQGSRLGPCLFTVYTSELLDIVGRHLPSMHSYADDTQLYLAFSPSMQGDDASAVKAMCDCIMDLRKWMTRDGLMLNDDKTEFLLLGRYQATAS